MSKRLVVAALFVSLLIISLSGCSRDSQKLIREHDIPEKSAQDTATYGRAPIPPWQVWTGDMFGSPELRQAEELVRKGELESALLIYQQIALSDSSNLIRDEALLRALGTMLKLGRSKEVLDEVSLRLKKEGKTMADVDPRTALIVAYAYLNLGNSDQLFAWFIVAHNRSSDGDLLRMRSINDARGYIRSIPTADFQTALAKWGIDPVLGPLFSEERVRRAQGGLAQANTVQEWFNPKTYTRQDFQEPTSDMLIDNSKLAMIPEDGHLTIGVLLPFTGKFAAHAERVRNGIEFAVSESDQAQRVNLIFSDTQGDPNIAVREYEDLVQNKGVSVVIGPLLLATTEAVAQRSRELAVPILSFTKRDGIPELGNEVFRLGATTKDQAQELALYVVNQLKLFRCATIYPNNESGSEFAKAFGEELIKQGGRIIAEVPYNKDSEDSVSRAIRATEKIAQQEEIDAIFIPDTLENAFAILERLPSSTLAQKVLLGPAYWDDVVAIRGYGQFLEGSVYVTPFFGRSVVPTVLDFVQRYKAKYLIEPELLSAQAYDATRFILQAVYRQDRRDNSVVGALHATESIQGVTGKLTVNQYGDIIRRMSVLRLVAGEVVEVMSAGEITGFLPDEQREKDEKTNG